jgi:ABC-type multidrug transport system fused ATPase/permease subunit
VSKRSWYVVAATGGCVAFILGIFLSPYLLDLISWGDADDVTRRSNIGQSYGAIAALLSGLALVGVALSLVLQRVQSYQDRSQAARDVHMRLIEQAIRSRHFAEAWGAYGTRRSHRTWRDEAYVNLIVSQWWVLYDLGSLGDAELLSNASSLFRGHVGRQYWSRVSERWTTPDSSKKQGKFVSIMNAALVSA